MLLPLLLFTWSTVFSVPPPAVTNQICACGVFAVVVAVAELLLAIESLVVVLTLTVLEITVPSVTDVLTLTTTEKVTVALAVSDAAVQVIEPFVPTPGVIQVHPAGTPIDLKVT